MYIVLMYKYYYYTFNCLTKYRVHKVFENRFILAKNNKKKKTN